MRSGRLFPNLFPDRALRQSRVRDLALAALAGVSLLWVAVPAWAQMACGSQSILDLVPAIEDADGDYVGDGSDNCVGVFNPHQIDADADGYGNACERAFYAECLSYIVISRGHKFCGFGV